MCKFAPDFEIIKNMIDISKIRTVQDFPKKGIKFYDITTVMNDPEAFRNVFDELVAHAKAMSPDVIVALEARGYFFGPAMALALGIPFVPIRKAGKLPYKTYRAAYHLEYGDETIEMHIDAMKQKHRVIIFDAILATGGTAAAAINLCQNFSPTFIGALFFMELEALQGRQKLTKIDEVKSLLTV